MRSVEYLAPCITTVNDLGEYKIVAPGGGAALTLVSSSTSLMVYTQGWELGSDSI